LWRHSRRIQHATRCCYAPASIRSGKHQTFKRRLSIVEIQPTHAAPDAVFYAPASVHSGRRQTFKRRLSIVQTQPTHTTCDAVLLRTRVRSGKHQTISRRLPNRGDSADARITRRSAATHLRPFALVTTRSQAKALHCGDSADAHAFHKVQDLVLFSFLGNHPSRRPRECVVYRLPLSARARC
jgi:hypothetical protein